MINPKTGKRASRYKRQVNEHVRVWRKLGLDKRRRGEAENHELYVTWRGMIRRCHDPRDPNYRYYGHRGIKVTKKWREDFWSFVADMGTRPEGHTIDRKNNEVGYRKSNCRWATVTQQNNNKRDPLFYNLLK